MNYETGEANPAWTAPEEKHQAISAHAAHGCGLPSLSQTTYWHDRWCDSERERARLLEEMGRCENMREGAELRIAFLERKIAELREMLTSALTEPRGD